LRVGSRAGRAGRRRGRVLGHSACAARSRTVRAQYVGEDFGSFKVCYRAGKHAHGFSPSSGAASPPSLLHYKDTRQAIALLRPICWLRRALRA